MSDAFPSHVIIDALFFVLGAIFGSFLNVCIYRIPRETSIVRPGSRCPGCGTPISFYHNIPLISYVVLGGRCRSCGQAIPLRYPLVELITAAIFVVFYRLLDLSLDLPVLLVFACLLVVISFIDLEFLIIPDTLSLGGLLLGVAVSFFRSSFSYVDSLLGVLVGAGVLFAIAKSYELVRKQEGMGGGDIKLLGMIGAFCGWKGVVFSLVSGSVAGTVVGIPLMLIKGGGTKYAIPFGPFLSLGALLYVVAGDDLIRLCLSLVAR
ncbi:MAG: prepilin peptidase [Syntrophorhabdales bacterium]|jgi:leader peptidase (prepilin peptidase)/N-methyltransferase